MWGDYASTEGSGTIYVQYRNDSTATITGRAILTVTEDSIHYMGPNLDSIHNHVARDYLPDQDGMVITINAGDSIVISEPFTIQPGWDESQCEIMSWLQNDSIYADSTREIWQGGMIEVVELIGVEEIKTPVSGQNSVRISPNPCIQRVEFIRDKTSNTEYRIFIYDVAGRFVQKITGSDSPALHPVYWDLRDENGQRVTRGVYLFRYLGDDRCTTGTIIVQ